MKYMSIMFFLLISFFLTGCVEEESVRYLSFDGMRFEEVETDLFVHEDKSIEVTQIGTTIKLNMPFVEATMHIYPNNHFMVEFEDGKLITCTHTSCVTENGSRNPYQTEDFRELAEGVQIATSEPVDPSSGHWVGITILLVLVSIITGFIGLSFERTKAVLTFFYALSWRFKGDVEPSDINVFFTRISLFFMPLLTLIWIIILIS